jgi:hypothetical protein
MCDWFLFCVEENPNFLQDELLHEEANVYITGEVNKRENPRRFSANEEQEDKRLRLWCPT